VRRKYAELGINARVQAFFSDMAEIYSQADLVVSRAGATTLAELTVFHKPVILVPFPFAADNHQEINGHYLVEAGGGLMFRQSDLDGKKLGMEITRGCQTRGHRNNCQYMHGTLERQITREYWKNFSLLIKA
jgi:UDP-N-acetylglucosamine--N-acetylmuramyl-(pentapeptide) pyrophosphoryl-undecaprenol N-acetylglucosamine transferase